MFPQNLLIHPAKQRDLDECIIRVKVVAIWGKYKYMRCFQSFLSYNTKHAFSLNHTLRLLSSKSVVHKPTLNLSKFTYCKFSISQTVCCSPKSPDVKILSNLSGVKGTEDAGKQSSSDNYSNPSEETKKNGNFSKRAMKYTFLAFGTMFTGVLAFVVYEWGSPHVDGEGNIIEDEFSHMPLPKAYVLRTYKEMMYYDKLIKEPSREKLLPEPLTEPYYQPPYTLALEMTGVLVHPDWTYRTGWRFKKRPGVDYFLQQVGPPLFEVVIYTSEQGFTAYPILDTLDPNGFIMYRLFRDATRYMDGHHVKDLSCLNRDLSKVIFIDWNEKSFSLQSENALKLKRWEGSDEDTTLYDLANLLRTIATSQIEDVRTVLEYYSQFEDPIAVFRDNQRRLKEEEEKRALEDRQKKPSLAGTISSTLLGRR